MIAPIVDHVPVGLDLLIEQYKGRPRIEGLLSSWLNRIQELEDAIWTVIDGRIIDTAVGVQLDTLGKLVGQLRGSETDEAYRAFIRARIRANRSLGHPGDLIAVTMLATGFSASGVAFTELPATTLIDLLTPTTDAVAAAVRALLAHAKPLGTALALGYSGYPEADTFAFADGDTVVTDTARGFAPNEDPNTTVSGGRVIESL